MLLFPCSVYIKPGLVSFAVFACTSSCLSWHFGLLQTLPPSLWSIPNPVGAWKGLYWVGWLGTTGHSPQDKELFVGFDHFSFSCFSTKVFQSCGIPSGIPSREVGSHLAPVSCSCCGSPTPPLTHLEPHSTPGVGVPALHSSEVPVPLLLFFLLARFTC